MVDFIVLYAETFIQNFKGSKGYIHNWKKRFNIKFKNFSGEGGSADDIIVDRWFSHLSQLLKQYDSQFVYNLDETGLYWKAGKGKSFITGTEAKDKDLRGTKMNKNRLTVLVGGSMTGEKLPLLVIGKSKKPRCFNGIKNLILDYTNQENSWMNLTIFNNYLVKLDKRLGFLLDPNKKALLIVDNCRAHPPSLASNYKNIDLKFFPPNITSRAQPMDMGIIHSLKSHYKNAMSKRKNDAINNKIQLNFSLLEAIHLLKDSWSNVTKSTIVNCFLKANFMIDESIDLEVIFNNDNDLDESFEDDSIQTNELDDFCINNIDNDNNDENDDNDNDVIVGYENKIDDEFFIKSITKPGTLDAIKAMEVMRNYLKLENPNLLCDFLRLENETNNSISFDKKTQTKIIDYMYIQ
jgi:hypothetical protein